MSKEGKTPKSDSPATETMLTPDQESEVIFLEDIDQFLEEDNPEFTMSLNEIVSEELGEDVEITSVDLDEKNLTVEEEKQRKKKIRILEPYPKAQEKLDKVFESVKSLPRRANSLGLKTKNIGFEIGRAIWKLLTISFPERIKYVILQAKSFIFWVQEQLQKFWAKDWPEKLLYFGACTFIVTFALLNCSLNII